MLILRAINSHAAPPFNTVWDSQRARATHSQRPLATLEPLSAMTTCCQVYRLGAVSKFVCSSCACLVSAFTASCCVHLCGVHPKTQMVCLEVEHMLWASCLVFRSAEGEARGTRGERPGMRRCSCAERARTCLRCWGSRRRRRRTRASSGHPGCGDRGAAIAPHAWAGPSQVHVLALGVVDP